MSVQDGVDRRSVMVTAGATLFLAGCGSDSDDDASSESTTTTTTATTEATATTSTSVTSDSTAEVIVATSDVPVDGGVITTSYVVTQPESGTYKCFTNVCTHQGCTVSSVEDESIKCACHNSTFSISTGEPTGGPATTALTSIAIEVSDGNIVKA
ncbi:Rieske (2Fe-2S) protein [Actinoplanes sp. NPDC051851]|uniref:Rieske (2Fe-2S) protein n=1 Tax=Actinoplanes sp. NPDC051851 TaxID=3154753 RepID=UPI00341F03E4